MTTDVTGGAVTATTETPASPEVPVSAEPATPKLPDQNEKRLAHMARREKALRVEAAKIKAERDAFSKEREEAGRAMEWKTKLSQKQFDVLSEAGITQEDLTQYLVNQPDPRTREIAELKAELQALKGGQDNINKKMEDQVNESYQQALRAINSEAKTIAKADLDRFELVNANLDDAVAAATALVEEIWKAEGDIIPVEEALNKVEEYYLETILNAAKASKKIQAKFAPAAVEQPTAAPAPAGKPAFSTAVREAAKQPVRTLTHQQIPSSAQAPKHLSIRERAILAFNANKKP